VAGHDAVVIGAGIVGLAVARSLAGRGFRVLVVEGQRVGAEASSAAGGILSAQVECDLDSPLFPLFLKARDLHARLAHELEEETGISLDYSTRGILELAFSEDEERALLANAERQRALGLPVEVVGPGELREAEANVTERARAALYFPADHRVDNVRLTRALAASALARGAAILSGRPVTRIIERGGAVTGVMAGAEAFDAPVVVNAAGAWAGLVAGDPYPPPVEPVKGQMVAFDVSPMLIRHVVCSRRGYIVPRQDGRVLAGSTTERAGFDKSVTAAGLAAVLGIALEIAPFLAEVRVADSWAGLRAGTPDGLPVLGPGGARGLFHAAGLYRNGILLGPLVGELLAAVVAGEPASLDLAPFSVMRFTRAV
jgi:glycine oxidase